MTDGIIEINSERGKQFRFTDDKFALDSYLWKKGDSILISFIVSQNPGKGDFSRLVKLIFEKGFIVNVPTPFAHMRNILKKWGFQITFDDGCEMWVKGPTT